MRPTRSARVAHQLQEEIAMIIQQELKDPGLGFVTITGVELSNDMAHAKVSFSCLGSEADQARSKAALDRSTHFVRSLIKKRLRLRIIPDVVFRYDRNIQGSIALEEKLNQLKATEGHGDAGHPPDHV